MSAKKPAYAVLARKYRPQGFDEVVGQPAVSVTIKNALSTGRVHHAYLFTGPRGVGKTTMARILAKALNCKKGPTTDPCGDCEPCREIASSSCLDVLEMDAASHTGVDNVREVILDSVGLAPTRDRRKVFIIDEAHMLSTAAFNALLKTLEEPPAHVVFILATTESSKIPATIASRCQRYRFRPVPADLLAGHLAALAKKEGMKAEPAALDLLARSAEGSLRDAVSLLDQSRAAGGDSISEESVREMFGFVPQELLFGVAQALLKRDAQDLGRRLKTIYAEGVEPAQLLKDLRAAFEALYLHKLGLEDLPEKALEPLAKGVSADACAFLLRRFNRILEELRHGDSPRLALELGLFACVEAASDLSAWVERLESLERRLASGATPAPASTAAPSVRAPAPPAAPAAPAAFAGDLWPALISAVRQERESLASSLEKGQLKPAGSGPWKLVFERTFDMKSAEKGLPLIEDKLSTIVGRPIKITLEQGSVDKKTTDGDEEAVDPGISTGSSTPPAGTVWKDIDGGSSGEPPAALKKAQQILGGKVRIVKKPGS